MVKTFPASLKRLYEMLTFVTEQAAALGFSEDDMTKIELAVEEALVNIISYGYPEDTGNIDIACENTDHRGIQIVIKDSGIAYNPVNRLKERAPGVPMDQEGVGGYGILFILKIMDEVNYIRENDHNILTLRKYKNG